MQERPGGAWEDEWPIHEVNPDSLKNDRKWYGLLNTFNSVFRPSAMVIRAFEFSKQTLNALEELAFITRPDGKDSLAQLIRDAVRTFEDIVVNQGRGRRIAFLEEQDLELLELAHKDDDNYELELLDNLIAPGKQSAAEEYIKKLSEGN